MSGREIPRRPETSGRDAGSAALEPRLAETTEVRLRPDLCPSVEEASAEAAVYLDWVISCRKGCGCGD